MQHEELALVLECPKCNRQGLVRSTKIDDQFECVYCKYVENLSSKLTIGKPFDFGSLLFGIVLGVLITLFMAANGQLCNRSITTTNTPPDSQQTTLF